MRISNEARVGLMVTASFTLFIVLVGVLAKINISQSGYHVRVYFSFLNDLSAGAPVKIAGGIKIGQVSEIRQSGSQTEVVVWIDNRYKLVKSTTFSIFTSGMIGEKYVNVIVPAIKDEKEFLKDGDIKYGIDPASFDQMMQTFQSFMQDKSGGEILADIFKNSNRFVENLNKVVDENKYDVRKSVTLTRSTMANLSVESQMLMKQLNLLTKNMAQLSERNKEDIAITLKNLSEITSNLNTIIFRLEKGRGTMGKLIYDEEIYNNLKDASISAKDLFNRLEKDPSLLLFRPKN
ncbi:MAG: MlaD family protein [Spirochaetota bacterium]